LYTIVYQKIEIINNTIRVSFAKAITIERRGRFKINCAFFVAQVSSMGVIGHKSKGGHVDKKGKKNSNYHYKKDVCTIFDQPRFSNHG
jgi:hypothetical protein